MQRDMFFVFIHPMLSIRDETTSGKHKFIPQYAVDFYGHDGEYIVDLVKSILRRP